jgi:LuxR family transcriptional regulator, maltose regulon positive regulatory protein
MASSEPPVLATKLHAPRRRRGVVERPRLTGRVAAGELPALTVVSAPAGFGKTTLLAQRFGGGPGQGPDDGSSTAWLSLDTADNDPALFWTAVIAALQGVGPGVGTDALALLQTSQPLATVVASLVNELAGHQGEAVLVLDDYHVIESAEVHAALAFLLDHLPTTTWCWPPGPIPRYPCRGSGPPASWWRSGPPTSGSRPPRPPTTSTR